MIKRLITIILLFLGTGTLFSQTLEISFPKLPGKEIRTYYFIGAKLDSLTTHLDHKGLGTVRFPENYYGFIQTVVDQSSIIEFIVGEENLKLESNDLRPSNINVNFPGSIENNFYHSILGKNKNNFQKKAWLEAGIEMYKENKKLLDALRKEMEQNALDTKKTEEEIKNSPLYAARFIEIMNFAEELFQAENQQDTTKIKAVKDYLQNRMDWKSLYTAGEYWNMVHNYTLSMFNKESLSRTPIETQQTYAAFICPLIEKREEPIRSAMFQSIINVCEAFGWETAKEEILSYVLEKQISLDTSNTRISRIMESYKTRPGETAPAISGITDLSNLLIIFYESGCNNCDRELELLEQNYSQLIAKGIRVVSISADQSSEVYTYHSKSFPWKDKLCDYKGFAGEAFSAYAITATPTLFVIDKNGKIQGRYANLKETGILQ